MLGVSVATVRTWEANGKITSTRTPGGQRRFDLAEIERVRAQGETRAAEAVKP